jgi:hypothetical protein
MANAFVALRRTLGSSGHLTNLIILAALSGYPSHQLFARDAATRSGKRTSLRHVDRTCGSSRSTGVVGRWLRKLHQRQTTSGSEEDLVNRAQFLSLIGPEKAMLVSVLAQSAPTCMRGPTAAPPRVQIISRLRLRLSQAVNEQLGGLAKTVLHVPVELHTLRK